MHNIFKLYIVQLNVYILSMFMCKDQKVCSPSPLRVTGCRLQTWHYVNKICKKWERITAMSSTQGQL